MLIIPNRLSAKIISAVLLSILISFATAGLFIYFIYAKILKEKSISELRILSRIVGYNCSAALMFEDKSAARDILSSFRSSRDVNFAVLYDKTGREFSYYIKPGGIYNPRYAEDDTSSDQILISENINVNGEIIGKIIVSFDKKSINLQIESIKYGILSSVFIALLIATVILLFFTRRIFKPVANLVDTMREISVRKDYSLRAERLSEDEFGQIVEGFNEMLYQIQKRDSELVKYREHLEEEVKKRTVELQEVNMKLESELAEVKRMEEVIIRSASEWRTTFDAIKDAVFLLDENGIVIRCNRSASELLNINYKEIIGKDICGTAHKLSDEDCGIKDAMRERIRISKILHINERVYQIYYDPIISNGKLTGFVHIMSDITEKYTLDENIRQVQKMEAIGRLAGGVAHDFNNLLSIMTLYTGSLIKRIKDDKRAINELNEIKKVIERATSLSRQLLAFSRKQIVNPEVFDVNESLRTQHKMLSRLIGENIKVELGLEDGEIFIFADKSQFENVIMNMVINAKDAMPYGGVITIQTERKRLLKGDIPIQDIDEKEFLILRVIDNGEGMSEEVQKKIFEPFFTTKPKGKGTGLGLSIVYGFVRQCNGYIEVKSKTGEGTTFILYFPIAEENQTRKESPSGLIKLPLKSNLQILLVEDDEDVRRSLVKMLNDNSFRVIDTGRAIEALQILQVKKDEIDMIISDIVMPEMNGIEFLKRVNDLNMKMPFLLMTGYSDEFLPQEDMSKYRDIIIQKPFTEKQLIKKIYEILR